MLPVRMERRFLLSCLALSLIMAACGPAGTGARGAGTMAIDVPDRITDETYPEMQRQLVVLALESPNRAALRDRIVEYLDGRTAAVLGSGSYDDAVALLARMTDLYSPEDFDLGHLPRQLDRVARFVVERGSPLGDEARVMSGLLILSLLHDDQPQHRAEYRRIREWGISARSTVSSPIERYSRLIDVWEEHARLTPAPAVLEQLADLHVQRRDEILRMAPGEGLFTPGAMSLQELQAAPLLVRRAPLDVAAVFLAHGDVATATTRVQTMGTMSGTEMRLLRELGEARDGDDDALLQLAQAYLEGRPDVARGICRLGRRRNAEDMRFPLCLARVSAEDGDYPTATGWYADAITLAPTDRGVYDEALDRLDNFIRRGIYDSDPSEARGMARAAEMILEERVRRWPDTPPAVTPARFHFVVAMLEMNAGNTDEARRRLEASISAQETADALVELGRLTESTGRADEAARLYTRALDRVPADAAEDNVARAQIQEHLGDAFRATGNEAQSARLYRQALALWDELLPQLHDAMTGDAQVRRGILLDRVGRRDDALLAFRQAMDATPDRRDVYSRILSYLVVATPDLVFARNVFDRAQRQLTLEPEWKVYFALWLEIIGSRARQDPGDDIDAVLRTASAGQAWWGRLARFGNGDLPYNELLSEASNIGEQTEAHFYEGARLLAAGDADGARRQFRRVLDAHMVNFYEYTMSLELLGRD